MEYWHHMFLLWLFPEASGLCMHPSMFILDGHHPCHGRSTAPQQWQAFPSDLRAALHQEATLIATSGRTVGMHAGRHVITGQYSWYRDRWDST